MTDNHVPAIRFLTIVFYLFAAVFSALASYRMHIEPIEGFALPILEAITNLDGRAPDQYRIIPYFIIGVFQDSADWLIGENLSAKYPVIFFDALFLCASAIVLRLKFQVPQQQWLILGLFLIYPFTMFDGYRPISSYLLFLSTLWIITVYHNAVSARKIKLFLLVVIFSFSRADVALLMVAIAVIEPGNRMLIVEKIALVGIPLLTQLLLQFLIFPEAVYFSPVIMVSDNASLKFILSSPLTYLTLGLLLHYWNHVWAFLRFMAKYHNRILIVCVCYVLALFVVARPNEFRLYLPFLPIVLWYVQEQMKLTANDIQRR